MIHTRNTAFLAATLAVTACASVPETTAAPDYREIAGDPAPAHGKLYADCLAQGAQTGRYRRADDGGGEELLLFTCDGDVARAFFDALAPWSAEIGSEVVAEGRTFRSTLKVQRGLFGVDYCSAAGGTDHRCVLSFNAGDFLTDKPFPFRSC